MIYKWKYPRGAKEHQGYATSGRRDIPMGRSGWEGFSKVVDVMGADRGPGQSFWGQVMVQSLSCQLCSQLCSLSRLRVTEGQGCICVQWCGLG